MKKYCLAAALTMAVLVPTAQADTILGLHLGVDGWKSNNEGELSYKNNSAQNFNFKDDTFISYYAALEHPVPLIPNIKLKYTELDLNGSALLDDTFSFNGSNYVVGTNVNSISELTHIDYILYYEIFDNDLLSIDLGLNVKQFDGDITVSGVTQQGGANITEVVEFSGFVPLAYARTEVGLPFTGLSVFFEGSLLAIDDSKIQDYQMGIAWEFIDNLAIDVAVKAGYRSMTLELDDIDNINTNIDASGPFAGIAVHF